jgi:hypothetical protein
MSYTIFAVDSTGDPVEHLLPGEVGEPSRNGHRVDADKLSGLIDTLLDLDGVSYVEVHDGSCARHVE